MRIIGLGSDLVSVKRVRRSLNGLGRPWAEKVLLPAELERAPSWDDAQYVARLFAAKEACSKALGTGMAEGVHWKCIEVVLPGKVILTGAALTRMHSAAGEAREGLMILDTFSKDELAGATAILYAVPRRG